MSEETNRSVPPPPMLPPQLYPPPPWWVNPPKTSGVKKFFRLLFILLFILSVWMNIVLGSIAFGGARDKMEAAVIEEGNGKDIVAVYEVAGMIDSKAAANLESFYQVVRDTAAIKAVVIRIDSGGGGVGASDEMYSRIKSIRDDLKKPLIVSMGSVAASGGYYIAAPADEIFAEPATVTGSIGVIAVWPVLKGTLEKIGVQMVTIRSSDAREWKARENYWEVPDEKILRSVGDMLDKMQQRFEQVVRDGRGDKIKLGPVEAVEATASTGAAATSAPAKPPGRSPLNGQVFVTSEAIANGLVDKLGYLNDAIAAAASKAGVSKPKVLEYHKKSGLLSAMSNAESRQQLDVKLLDEITSPRVMMLWKP